jgi:hypothetical protein
MHTYTHAWDVMPIFRYLHTYIHAYINTCIRTYMHTYIHTHKVWESEKMFDIITFEGPVVRIHVCVCVCINVRVIFMCAFMEVCMHASTHARKSICITMLFMHVCIFPSI